MHSSGLGLAAAGSRNWPRKPKGCGHHGKRWASVLARMPSIGPLGSSRAFGAVSTGRFGNHGNGICKRNPRTDIESEARKRRIWQGRPLPRGGCGPCGCARRCCNRGVEGHQGDREKVALTPTVRGTPLALVVVLAAPQRLPSRLGIVVSRATCPLSLIGAL